ncbi:MAG: hypothetical protein ACKVS8_09045 [Phycisphaerales bacterium]
MQLTRRNTAVLLTLGTTIGGLALDRTVLSGALSGPRASSAAEGMLPDEDAAVFRSASPANTQAASLISLAQRLAAVPATSGPVQDAMLLPDSWAKALLAAKAVKGGADAATAEGETFNPHLSAIVVGADGARAKVDGAFVRVGQRIRGWTLVSVSARAAVFEREGQRHEAKLSAPGR